jgi:ADP-ribosyl-[dinitrogen reductase] hydrolase
MTIGLIEFMLSGEEWTKENITKYFLKAFKREQRCGYAKGFYNFLLSVDDEIEFLEKIHPESIRNGSMMRSVPLSLIKDVEELKEKAKMQSIITHNTHEGVVASQAVGFIGNYFLYQNGKAKDLVKYINAQTGELFRTNFKGRVPCAAIETVDAVLTVLLANTTYKDILDHSVRLGGDTDSVAAVALGLTSLSSDYVNDLPNFLYEDLENEKYGKDYLKSLDL